MINNILNAASPPEERAIRLAIIRNWYEQRYDFAFPKLEALWEIHPDETTVHVAYLIAALKSGRLSTFEYEVQRFNRNNVNFERWSALVLALAETDDSTLSPAFLLDLIRLIKVENIESSVYHQVITATLESLRNREIYSKARWFAETACAELGGEHLNDVKNTLLSDIEEMDETFIRQVFMISGLCGLYDTLDDLDTGNRMLLLTAAFQMHRLKSGLEQISVLSRDELEELLQQLMEQARALSLHPEQMEPAWLRHVSMNNPEEIANAVHRLCYEIEESGDFYRPATRSADAASLTTRLETLFEKGFQGDEELGLNLLTRFPEIFPFAEDLDAALSHYIVMLLYAIGNSPDEIHRGIHHNEDDPILWVQFDDMLYVCQLIWDLVMNIDPVEHTTCVLEAMGRLHNYLDWEYCEAVIAPLVATMNRDKKMILALRKDIKKMR